MFNSLSPESRWTINHLILIAILIGGAAALQAGSWYIASAVGFLLGVVFHGWMILEMPSITVERDPGLWPYRKPRGK